MDAAAFASRLPDARFVAGQWKARCPAHEDGTPSLAIKDGDDGKVVLKDFGGCPTTAIVEAMGLSMADLFPPKTEAPPKPRPRVIAEREYEIRDADGVLQAIHIRLDMSDGSKSFPWRLPGATANGLGGTLTASLPLYGSEHLAGVPDGPVVVTEGEKACEAVQAAGLAAVGTVTGAGNRIPAQAPLSVLQGRDVVLWADNDDKGVRHMRDVAAALGGVARSRRWVTWPEAPAKGDAADVPDEQMLRRLVDQAAQPEPERPRSGLLYTVRELADLPSADEEYIMGSGIMTRGSKLLIYGKSGCGKTTLLDDICGALASGRPWLGRYAVDKARSVLVIQGELSLPEMASHAQALVAAGVTTDNLKFARMTDLRLPKGLEQLRSLIEESGASVVAMDPWYRLFTGESSNASEQVDGVFGVCDRLLEDGLVEAVIVVHHANTTGLRTAGSWVFEGWPSTILKLEEVPGVATHRIVVFEKIRAPGSTLLGEQLRIVPTEDGYMPIVVTAAPTAAGEILAALVVREAGGQLYRQELIARLMVRAMCRERAAAKYLGKAVQSGMLRSVPSGQQVIYQLVEQPEEAAA